MNLRPLLIIPPLALAAYVFVSMNAPKEVDKTPPEEGRLAVRVMTVDSSPIQASANGFGRVTAMREWTAVAEVQGRVISMREELAAGSIVEAGEVLLTIDSTDYELAREKARANITSVNAQLSELDRQEENTERTLELEERILLVAQAEFDRVASLVERGTSTKAALDNAQKAFLSQSASVMNLKNTIALYPAKRQSLQATLSVRQAELAEAERAISKVVITAPFRARVSEQNTETGQFVRTGDRLLSLDDISAVEITAEVQPSVFAPMIAVAFSDQEGPDTVVDTSQAVEIIRKVGISAEVSMSMSGYQAIWPAEIVRMRGTMDSQTGALGLVVRVDEPLVSLRPVSRPPLNVGSFVQVTFRTKDIDGIITVPRNAVRYDELGRSFVYLADGDNRLRRRMIEIGPVIDQNVVVEEGLSLGDTLVLSDPHPPVLGMALEPVKVSREP